MDAYLPMGQLLQSDKVTEPVDGRYLPATQPMQLDEPAAEAYLPASHALQLKLPLEEANFPAAQAMQSDAAVEPGVSTYLPGGQKAHLCSPIK
jgi:hypothetical protein